MNTHWKELKEAKDAYDGLVEAAKAEVSVLHCSVDVPHIEFRFIHLGASEQDPFGYIAKIAYTAKAADGDFSGSCEIDLDRLRNTGADGRQRVLKEVVDHCKKEVIELIADRVVNNGLATIHEELFRAISITR